MTKPAVPRPTREQLLSLLFSDPASEAWEFDAADILASDPRKRTFFDQEEGPLAACRELVAVVESELGAVTEGGGEDDAEGLEDLACGAKRCAIMLLAAAWAAGQAAEGPASAEPGEVSPQLEFLAGESDRAAPVDDSLSRGEDGAPTSETDPDYDVEEQPEGFPAPRLGGGHRPDCTAKVGHAPGAVSCEMAMLVERDPKGLRAALNAAPGPLIIPGDVASALRQDLSDRALLFACEVTTGATLSDPTAQHEVGPELVRMVLALRAKRKGPRIPETDPAWQAARGGEDNYEGVDLPAIADAYMAEYGAGSPQARRPPSEALAEQTAKRPVGWLAKIEAVLAGKGKEIYRGERDVLASLAAQLKARPEAEHDAALAFQYKALIDARYEALKPR